LGFEELKRVGIWGVQSRGNRTIVTVEAQLDTGVLELRVGVDDRCPEVERLSKQRFDGREALCGRVFETLLHRSLVVYNMCGRSLAHSIVSVVF
jgi:hypothetical protein